MSCQTQMSSSAGAGLESAGNLRSLIQESNAQLRKSEIFIGPATYARTALSGAASTSLRLRSNYVPS
jgi:hypothetical protein